MKLQAASWPRDEKRETGLILTDRENGRIQVKTLGDLPDLLRKNDLLILNDAATLPASLFGKTEGGDSLELRLLSEVRDGEWRTILFGAGDWRERTEDRAPPPELSPGEDPAFGPTLKGKVKKVP